MKVAIIGGAGRVGACAAYALQCAGIVSEIHLSDIMADVVKGEALDLLHGSSLLHGQRIVSGDIQGAAAADMVIMTAGLRRKPDESRMDLINRNVSLFLSILQDLKQSDMNPDGILLVVSNPVDILTHLAVRSKILPSERILGLGTLLDTARFSSLIADAIGTAASQVRALILGEHGDSMVPIWSSATCSGLPLEKHPALSPPVKTITFEQTRQSGAEMIRLKGGAGWAVGAAIATVVHSVALDKRQALPVSSLQKGAYGLQDVCISVPTLIGRSGIIEHIDLELWPRELQQLKNSADTVRSVALSLANWDVRIH